MHFKKQQLFKKVHTSFGVIGVLIINNMMADTKIHEHLIHQGDEMKFSLQSFEEERIKYAFYLLLVNILICFRSLRNPEASEKDDK